MNDVLPETERTRLRRMNERGHFDRKTINAILDAMPMCHIGYLIDSSPIVIPVKMQLMEPVPDPRNMEGIGMPDYLGNIKLG